ncbi:MAG: hypothetical protein QXM93_09505 [Candidatus Methanomethyliaceae archaeon]
MDIIEELIEELRNDSQVKQARLSNKFLATVGDVCSRYGYGAVRLFLMGQDEPEAIVLLRVLEKIESRGLPSELGTLIFKKLNAIKFAGGE